MYYTYFMVWKLLSIHYSEESKRSDAFAAAAAAFDQENVSPIPRVIRAFPKKSRIPAT